MSGLLLTWIIGYEGLLICNISTLSGLYVGGVVQSALRSIGVPYRLYPRLFGTRLIGMRPTETRLIGTLKIDRVQLERVSLARNRVKSILWTLSIYGQVAIYMPNIASPLIQISYIERYFFRWINFLISNYLWITFSLESSILLISKK